MTAQYLIITLLLLSIGVHPSFSTPFQLENLDRGVIAMERDDGSIYLGWRLLATDPGDISFVVYRDGRKLTDVPITSSTNLVDADGSADSRYAVSAVIDGAELPPSASVSVVTRSYISIPLQRDLSYGGNHVGVGDLDGDGVYDYLVKRGSQDIDPSQGTVATNTFKLEAYKSDGAFLWRLDLGWNIRQGIWYSPVLVYDLDGDGHAEVITKIGETSEDWNGDGRVDYRSGAEKRILSGPEYFVIVDGETGGILARENWIERGVVSSWGDDYGNRVDRNMMCVAYLDGQRPSLIILRGTYTKMFAEAWNWRDGQLTKLWRWSLASGGGGFHNLRTGDIDGDGRDEIVNGSIAIDDDGVEMWKTGEGHGDRMHMTDIDPERPGLEIWYVQEDPSVYGIHLTDAADGTVIWGIPKAIAGGDVGRGLAADIDPNYYGLECWASVGDLNNCRGNRIGSRPSQCNMAIWWDGDLLRELLDGAAIQKYGGDRLLTANGTAGPRNAPMGYGDILGDWREEVWYIANNNELRIYSTTMPTDRRFVTLMHDKDYRISVACEMVGYMQATQPSFYIGVDMDLTPEKMPPFEPLGLQGLAGQDSVQLLWRANGESDLAGYHVYRAESSGGPYSQVNAPLLRNPEYVDRLVVNETTYYYAVTAVDIDGNESRFSEEIEAMPTSIPVSLLGLSAGIEIDFVRLFWHANPERDIAGYNIYRSQSVEGVVTKQNSELVSDTCYTDTQVNRGSTYYYSVVAVDEDGNQSPGSKELTAIPDLPIRVQAEDALLLDGCRIRNQSSGYNGSGFVDFYNDAGALLFDHINGREGGDHALIIRYAQRTTSASLTGLLRINGLRKIVRTYDTGSQNTWRSDTLTITLNAGMDNTLIFSSPNGDFCNLDEIIVIPAGYVGVRRREILLPIEYALRQNYPNPFNDGTIIEFALPQISFVTLEIIDLQGRQVAVLIDGPQPAGVHKIRWDGRGVASGIYFYRFTTPDYVEEKKLILMR